MVLKNRWKAGPEREFRGPYVFSATEFAYRRLAQMPRVWLHGALLRRGWGGRAGAVGLATAVDLVRPVTYTLSVWTSREALRAFIGSPEHTRLVERFRPRQVRSASVVWQAEELVLDDAWREGRRRLEARRAR